MSSLTMPSMASATRFARARSGSFIIPASTAGTNRWGITSGMMPPSRERLARVVVADEVADAGHDLLAPFAAVEDAVVADPRLLPVDVAGARNVGGEGVRRLGLADARDVVELAFDRHQGGLDEGGIDLAAAAHPGPVCQPLFLEDDFDGLQIELGGEVHDGEIFVVEGAVAVGRIVVAFHQVLELAHVGVDVPIEIHADEGGELQEARIDAGQRA